MGLAAALDAEVTLGEIGDIYRQVWGDWATPIQNGGFDSARRGGRRIR